MARLFHDAQQAIDDIGDGATIMVGGFGGFGIPENLIRALRNKGSQSLTIITSSVGMEENGIGLLCLNKQVRKIVTTDLTEDSLFENLVLKGELQIELSPQGTFAERIRSGGAGIGGFYTPTGYGTIVAENKETRFWQGENYLLELPLRAEFAFVKAWRGDPAGNLVYKTNSRNFNPLMATAADVTVAEVDELAAPGVLDPDHIHTAGIYVQRICHRERSDNRLDPPGS